MYFQNLEMHIFRHILTRIPKNQNFFHKTLKNQKIFSVRFSANNEQNSMKRGEKWFSEKLRKFFDLEYFRSDSFSIRTSRIESSRFRARVAKGRPAFRDRITRRSLESKIVYRGVGSDFEKPRNIFG